MSDASDRADCITAARNGTLAQNDQRFQAIQRQARQGVPAAVEALRQINEHGGPHGGSVNRFV